MSFSSKLPLNYNPNWELREPQGEMLISRASSPEVQQERRDLYLSTHWLLAAGRGQAFPANPGCELFQPENALGKGIPVTGWRAPDPEVLKARDMGEAPTASHSKD